MILQDFAHRQSNLRKFLCACPDTDGGSRISTKLQTHTLSPAYPGAGLPSIFMPFTQINCQLSQNERKKFRFAVSTFALELIILANTKKKSVF